MSGRVEKASVIRIAREIGLDIDQIRRDMEAPKVQAHLDTTMQLANAMGFNGTPSFVIGDEVVPGRISAEQMTALIETARAAD